MRYKGKFLICGGEVILFTRCRTMKILTNHLPVFVDLYLIFHVTLKSLAGSMTPLMFSIFVKDFDDTLPPCAHRFLSMQSRCKENSLCSHRAPHQHKLKKSPIKFANYDPLPARFLLLALTPTTSTSLPPPAFSLSRRAFICLAHASSLPLVVLPFFDGLRVSVLTPTRGPLRRRGILRKRGPLQRQGPLPLGGSRLLLVQSIIRMQYFAHSLCIVLSAVRMNQVLYIIFKYPINIDSNIYIQ